MSDPAVVDRLEALIVALDKRHVQPARPGEAAIVRDAANQRARAVKRLAELHLADGPPVLS
jgi:hypothetical protein